MAKIELTKRDDLGIIVIQNPPFNQLSSEVFEELEAALADIKEDSAIKCFIITGRGLFSAGADVKEIWDIAREKNKEKGLALLAKANAVVNMIEKMDKPSIAAVDGFCLGGGNELTMACTARIATDQTKFGQPEIGLGIMPGMGGTQRLPRLVNIEKALTMLIAGTLVSAKDAASLGLVDRVVSQKQLIPTTKELALDLIGQTATTDKWSEVNKEVIDGFHKTIRQEKFKILTSSKSAEAVGAILDAVQRGLALPFDEALELEQQLFVDLVMKDSAMEGLAKFLKINLNKKEDKAPTEQSSNGENLSEEYELLKETAITFARNEIAPKVKQMEADHNVTPELIQQMAELGFFGACFPENYGGVGLGKTGYCMIIEAITRMHASTATLFGAHVGLACGAVYIGGNEEQKQKYLRAGIEGKMIGAFALTEPEAGSDSGNIQTMAEKKGDKWILNGRKQFITNGDIADFVVVIAQTDKFLRKDGLTAFIVESSWSGFSIGKVEDKMGIRASRTTELIFENLEVPEENLLGQVGQGFKVFMKTLNGGRLALAAGCLGAAKEAFEMAYKHAAERRQFDSSLIGFQAIQFYFAEMRSKIYLMETGIYEAARKADAGIDIRLDAAILKLSCSEMSSDVIDTALQIIGGPGYMEEDPPIARMYRDARINRIFEGTSEMQKLLIFKEVFITQGKIE